MRRSLLLIALLSAGCATTRPPSAADLPDEGFITHRAVLNAPGRQFTFNGYLSTSTTGGRRLVIAENFGGTLADVLVKPDGKIYVMKSSAAFPAERIRKFVARDLECVFGGAEGRISSPEKNHLVLQRIGYSLDIRLLEIRRGPQDAKLFDAAAAEQP